MSANQQLSRIRKIQPRTVWPDEARNFTPWLEKNIAELSVVLGFSLESKGKEVSAGTRSIDILATDTDTGRPVIIENQFGKSDGDHLSRLLIYASYKNAHVIIWIAEEFDDEHWRTLKWLNRRTESGTKFFGVVIELLTIDDSPPAPHFRVVIAPDDWRQRRSRGLSVSDRRRFRKALENSLKQTGLPFQEGDDHPHPWLSIHYENGVRYAVDFRSEFTFAYQLESESTCEGLEWCHDTFESIERDRERIEEKLGRLEWVRNWEKDRGSQIVSRCPLPYYDLIESSEELHKWAVEQYCRFREVFDEYRRKPEGYKTDRFAGPQ